MNMGIIKRKEMADMTDFIGFNYCVVYENGHLSVERVDEVNNDREIFLSSDRFDEEDFHDICTLLRNLTDGGYLL